MSTQENLRRPEFVRLAGLVVPAEPAAVTVSTWDAGEWGLAVEDLAQALSEHHTPLLRADRAAVLELAAALDVSTKVAPALRWCPDPGSEHQWWRAIENQPRSTAVAHRAAVVHLSW